jgi:hypothetical protein
MHDNHLPSKFSASMLNASMQVLDAGVSAIHVAISRAMVSAMSLVYQRAEPEWLRGLPMSLLVGSSVL